MFLSSTNKINITLCGMMGSGKSIIGKRLAKKIDFSFIDTDILIEEKSGKTINQIFTEDGENYFRKLEEQITTNTLKNKNYVISLGGGAITNRKIRELILEKSYNIYLEVGINILAKRLSGSNRRPLLINKNIKKTLIDILKRRKKFYHSADLILKNEINADEVVNKIIKRL